MSSANATIVVVVSEEESILINISNRGVIPMAYIAIANGSPCVVPSRDKSSFPPIMNSLAGIR